jgi:general secretion pathway protein I
MDAESMRKGPLTLSRGGFTLLEIMIALAIISIAMISLLSLANRTIRVHDRLQQLTIATLLAQQRMAETEVNTRDDTLDSGDNRGDFADPYQDYSWRITYADTPLPSVRMVTVTVFRRNEEQNELVDLTSFIF